MENKNREIPVAVSIKLFNLKQTLMELPGLRPKKKSKRSVAQEDINHRLVILEYKLKKMQDRYLDLDSELLKIQSWRKIPHDKGHELLYDLKEGDLEDKLECCSPAKQQELMDAIEMLKNRMGEV
jgi:hypothetical protein